MKIVMLMILPLLFACGQQGPLFIPDVAPTQSSPPQSGQAMQEVQSQGPEQP